MNLLKDGLVLYHGSYCVVEQQNLEKCAKNKDFGKGFYLTSSKEQAKNFAKISSAKAKSRGLISASENFAYVSFFKALDVEEISYFSFETADVDWLHCVVAHRKKDVFGEVLEDCSNYDVIGGKSG